MKCSDYREDMTPEEVVKLIEHCPPGPWIGDWHQRENVKQAHRIMVEQFIPTIDASSIEYPQKRGIVIAGGGLKYLPSVWVGVNLIREQGCKLPIQLWYLGDNEVDPFVKRLLEPLGVECIDARKVEQEKPFRILCGWELKLYSVWNSPFEEVLFLDADSAPVRDVTDLFDRPSYSQHGAAFWPDYANWTLKPDVWSLFGIDKYANQDAARNEWALESGQFMVHKNKSSLPFQLAMWYAAHSDFTFGHVYGDKETFHLAWRKLGLEYASPKRPPGWNNHTIVQWDVEDTEKVLFQHRVQDKWRLDGTNRFIDSLANEQRCQDLCGLLKMVWSGTLWENARMTATEQAAHDVLVGKTFIYERVGFDSRPIKLDVGHTITLGKAECESRWWLNNVDGIMTLTISRIDRPTCHLTMQSDNSWCGHWLEHERMPIRLTTINR